MELIRSDEGGAVVIAVSGDLDIATADQLFREAHESLRASAPTRLVLDLSGVSFLDSSGIGTLVELRNVATDTGGALTLRRPSDRTRRLLEITALDTVFTIDACPAPAAPPVRPGAVATTVRACSGSWSSA